MHEEILYRLHIRDYVSMIVSNPPVPGNFNRMTTYKTISVDYNPPNGIKKTVIGYKRDSTVWVNPDKVVYFEEIEAVVVE